MGTKFAPVYATLVIGYLEEKIYSQINMAITVLMNLSVTGKDFSMTVLYRGLSQSQN